MGRLHRAAVECNYQEVDRQLKEQFFHGLNDKHMVDASGGILAWSKRVEAQRAQAAVLNTLSESKQFDKIKISKKAKDDRESELQ